MPQSLGFFYSLNVEPKNEIVFGYMVEGLISYIQNQPLCKIYPRYVPEKRILQILCNFKRKFSHVLITNALKSA